MIKTAIQYIIGLGAAEIHEENGQVFSDRNLQLLEEPKATPFEVHTLSGLVDYLQSHVDGKEPVIVHVVSPTEVTAKSALNKDKRRGFFIRAEALLPRISFNSYYDVEDFNILLQSSFVSNNDKKIMLQLVGNIREENVREVGDDGISQSVVAKASVSSAATVANVEVPNPVELIPYRTFIEVDQPESQFVFRMKDGPRAAIFEADGGAWKINAIENIREYLEKTLEEEIGNGRVHIIA